MADMAAMQVPNATARQVQTESSFPANETKYNQPIEATNVADPFEETVSTRIDPNVLESTATHFPSIQTTDAVAAVASPVPPTGNSTSLTTFSDGQITGSSETVQDDNDLEATFIHLQGLWDSIKKNVEGDCLQQAITSLESLVDNHAYPEETRSKFHFQLINVLLTRYAIYQWIEDFDICINRIGKLSRIIVDLAKQEYDESLVEIQASTQLLHTFRDSLDINTLKTIIKVAAESLISDTQNVSVQQRANLLVISGNALVTKFLCQGVLAELDDATSRFQEAERISMGNLAISCISGVSQAHLEWLRLVECGEVEAFRRSQDCMERLINTQGEMLEMSEAGIKLATSAVDDTQIQEAIACLTTVLDRRITPHPQRLHSLEWLSDALSTRFERQGTLPDLDHCVALRREALNLRPEPHPQRFISLSRVADSLFTHFEKAGSLHNLEECIALRKDALSILPPQHPERASLLLKLSYAVSHRFKQNRAFQDLEDTVSFNREALRLQPASHLHRHVASHNLANSLFSCFERSGALADLEECIVLYREALSLQPTAHPNRALYLYNLATAVSARFDQNVTLVDLEESICLHRQALDLRPSPHPDRFFSLVNLGVALSDLFQKKGAYGALEECINLWREALIQVFHVLDHFKLLSNLGNALFKRFLHKGALQDIEDCIVLHREALGLQPASHVHRASSLRALATALLDRSQLTGAFQDLEECIGLHREALRLQPSIDPGQLAEALRIRFVQKGAFQDIDECISLYRGSLRLEPSTVPASPMTLSNLASALSTRFEHKGTGHWQDLEECLVLHQEALNLLPPPHPTRLLLFNNLAMALQLCQETLQSCDPALFSKLAHTVDPKFDTSQENTAMELALCCLEKASRYQTGSLLKRLKCSGWWAALAHRLRPSSSSALEAYRYAMRLLPLLASLDTTLQQRQDVLRHSQELVRNAAKSAIIANECETAIEFLSTGRSVFWSQALQLRTAVDDLIPTHPNLAEKFIALSRELEHASFTSSELLTSSNAAPGTHTSLYALADQRCQTIEEIQKIPGFESFLEPPVFASLQCAAKNGPVILLNASEYGCDALIMHGTGSVEFVPLPKVNQKELEALKSTIQSAIEEGVRTMDISRDGVETFAAILGRDMSCNSLATSNEHILRLALECLWISVAQPVVAKLGIDKSNLDLPKRHWWCPTGSFSLLPIHAAGIYSDDNEPIDCLFEYMVPSYITSPQDLLHPQPQITDEFKMMAIIEPEVPGAAFLPATLDELKEIKKHIPDLQKHLLVHVGSRENPIPIDDLITDIQRSSFSHFGCHGMQNMKDPLESYLLLSGGRLTMSKVIKECRVTEGALAYLSACETAKGDELRPEESLNLVATMMFAGFRSVVGTMWSIVDEDAPVVADVFYRHLFRNGAGAPPDVRDAAYSLHLATKELRDRRKLFSRWVPYVHYGI